MTMSPWLRLALSIACLALALWFAAPVEVLHALRNITPAWLAMAVLLLAAQIALSALRWRVTAEALGHSLPRRWCLQEYGLSVAVNTFLPGGVMGDLARIARARHLGWQAATASVVIERLTGQAAMGAVALGSVVLWLGGWHGPALLVAVLLTLLLAVRLLPGPRAYLAQAWLAPGLWRWQAGLTLMILSVNLAGYWAAAQAVGIALPLGAALMLIPLTLLAMLIPITINGWGLREGAAAALWPLWGIGAAQAVAASMAFGIACMAAALIGLLPWLMRKPDPRKA